MFSTLKVGNWVGKVDKFLSVLALLTYLVGGQPPRGTELTAFLCSNSSAEARSVYCHEGAVIISQSYSKNRSAQGKDRRAVRFLDDVTSQLYLAFLVALKPLYNKLLATVPLVPASGASPKHPHHLFTKLGAEWSEDKVSDVFQDTASEYVWGGHGLSTLRQGLDAIAKVELPHKLVLDPLEETMEAVFEQAGHSARTSTNNYGLDASAPGGVDTWTLLKSQAASTFWHSVLLLTSLKHPTFRESPTDFTSSPASSHATSPKDYTRRFGEVGGAVWSGRGVELAGQATPPPTGEELRGDWTASLDTYGSLPPLRFCSPFTNTPPPVLGKETHENLLRDLRQASGSPDASFKSTTQALAFNLLLNSRNDGVVVLQTGGGKTFLLSALGRANPDKVTVVVFPLVSLRETYFLQASSKPNAPSIAVWTTLARDPGKALFRGLVLVGNEQALSNEFKVFLDALQSQGALARVVVDEGDVPLTSGDFRPNLQQLYRLRRHRVPLFILSAKLPPSSVPALCEVYRLPCPTVVRATKTSRANLCYEVRVSSGLG